MRITRVRRLTARAVRAWWPRVVAKWLPSLAAAEVEPRITEHTICVLRMDVVDEAGDPLTVYYSTRAMVSSATSTPAHETFRELVTDPGSIRRQAFGSDRASAIVAPTWGAIELNNAAGQLDAWIDYATDGGKVTCYYGPHNGAFPGEFRVAYIAYIDGRPSFDYKRIRLSVRGRERLFDKPIVEDGFDGTGGLEGTGVAGSRLQQIAMGAPGYQSPILIDATENAWFVHANRASTLPTYFDGGVELADDGSYSGPETLFTWGDPAPGGYRHAQGAYGPLYVKLGSTVRVELRAVMSGLYADAFTTPRRWNVCDLAARAGVTGATAGTMASGSEPLDAGNRLVETESFKDVLADIAMYEVAAIGFTRLDEFFAKRILPSTDGSSVHTFVDGQNSRAWSIAPPPGADRRVWQVRVMAGATSPSALAGIVEDDIRDALSRGPWAYNFTATVRYANGILPPRPVTDTDPNAERIELQIIGHEFTTEAKMADWALRYMKLHASRVIGFWLEAPLTTDTLALELLDLVTLQTSRFGGSRAARIWSIEVQLKQRIIRFGLVAHSDVPTLGDIYIEHVDDTVGAGGSGSGSGATGGGTAAPQIESFVVACSDEATAITAGTSKRTFFAPYDLILTEVQASLATAQSSGATFTVDVNQSGSSILSTKITIDNTESTSITAAAQPVISTSALLKGAKITFDVDQVGNGTAKGLVVSLIGYQA